MYLHYLMKSTPCPELEFEETKQNISFTTNCLPLLIISNKCLVKVIINKLFKKFMNSNLRFCYIKRSQIRTLLKILWLYIFTVFTECQFCETLNEENMTRACFEIQIQEENTLHNMQEAKQLRHTRLVCTYIVDRAIFPILSQICKSNLKRQTSIH